MSDSNPNITTYPGYAVFRSGEIWRLATKGKAIDGKPKRRALKVKPHQRKGYHSVWLFINGKKLHITLHRVVAACFIPEASGCTQIDHINQNKADNRAENLRWVTPIENILNRKNWQTTKVPVNAIYPDGLQKRFESKAEAARELGVSYTAVRCSVEDGTAVKGIKFQLAN
jgi:hypothetical protein